MKIVFIVLLAIFVILSIIVLAVRAIRRDNSPLIAEGYQDANGFHYGKPE